jgi:enoyl-CoA hydratase
VCRSTPTLAGVRRQDDLDYIAAWQSGMFLSADLMETMQAKAEKHQPTFADLLPARKLVRK